MALTKKETVAVTPKTDTAPVAIKWYRRKWFIIAAIVIFWPVGLFLAWRYAKWPLWLKTTLTAFYVLAFVGIIVAAINAPPYLDIDHLAADNRINTDNTSYTLSGDAPLGSVVTVNGVTASWNGDKFSATIPLKEGDNDITVKATDSKGEDDQHVIIHRTTAAEFQARRDAAAAATKRAANAKAAADAQKAKEAAAAAKTAANLQPQTTPPAAPTPQSTPQHTIVYSYDVDSGHLTNDDIQNVGISWNDPVQDKNQIPQDIAGAITQIAAGGYAVTYHVDTVDLAKIHSGIANSEPDATLSCTIMIDGQLAAVKQIGPNDVQDCFAQGNN